MNASLIVALGSVTFAVGLLVQPVAAAGTFECPYSKEAGAPAMSRDISAIIPDELSREQRDDLDVAINDLRRGGLSPDQIVNHLVATYCPAAASVSALSIAEKNRRVRQFASEVTQMVLPPSDEEAVIYNVTLTSRVSQKARVQAQKAGLSVEQWIAHTIEAAVQ